MVGLPHFVVFELDGFLYALPLAQVRRVVPALEPTPLPQAPPIVLGAIDLAGEIIPALDMRPRFGLAQRPMRVSDQLLIAETDQRSLALLIDRVTEVRELPVEAILPAGSLLPGLERLEGVTPLEGGLVLIHDLERLLSLEEHAAIGLALEAGHGVEAGHDG